ncbi:MAG: hypothetical protein ACRBHB_18240 [Arenicella sp.]
MDIEIFSLVANIGALTVAGVLYVSYIKNLRAGLKLKDQKMDLITQRVSFWKEKALSLERNTPQFIELQLNDRIKVREQEIERLAEDGEQHLFEIEKKNQEIASYAEKLQAVAEYSRALTVYDSELGDFKSVEAEELTIKYLGEIFVDTASIIICDPWYMSMDEERERDEFVPLPYKYKNPITGELFFTGDLEEHLMLDDMDDYLPVSELVALGKLVKLPYSDNLPADPKTYIKGHEAPHVWRDYKRLSFLNGRFGAGIEINTGADGGYQVKAECYKGAIQRVVIDL